MRTITASLIQEKNKLAAPSAWLPLITVEVSASTTLRLVPNPTAVVFDGQTYAPFGCEIEDVMQDAKGQLHDVSISVSNVTREISAYVEFNELRGARVSIRYVNSANLADPEAVVLEEHYEIMSIQVKGSQFVTFILGHDRIVQHVFPGRRFYRDNCSHLYLSKECGLGWTALDTLSPEFHPELVALATCSKALEGSNGCRAHANVARFGGYPLLSPIAGRL